MTLLAEAGATFCAEIPDQVLDQVKAMGNLKMTPRSKDDKFPAKGTRWPSNLGDLWVTPPPGAPPYQG
jgi:hypothetical protein